jgi:hypothetical protein
MQSVINNVQLLKEIPMSKFLMLVSMASIFAVSSFASAAPTDPCKAKAANAAAGDLRKSDDFAPVDPENGFNEIKKVIAAPVRGSAGEYTVTVDFGAKSETDENGWITAIYSVRMDAAHGCRLIKLERTE